MKKLLFIFSLFILSCTQETNNTENAVAFDSTLTAEDSANIRNVAYRIEGTIEVINFKHGGFTIEDKDFSRLQRLSDICFSDSFAFLKAFGFTDTIGTETHNASLSEKRAMAVYQRLDPENRINKQQVYVTWLGESADAYDLHFPEAHVQQNCVDVWIMTRKKQ